jgi:hypothetical protein
MDGFGLVMRFIEILENVTTNNYNTIVNPHTLQFTTAHTKSSSLLYLHRSLSGNGFQLRSFLSFRVHALTGRWLSHN